MTTGKAKTTAAAPMGLERVTSETIGKDLGCEIPEVFVVIAKYAALGMDEEGIRDLLDCGQSDLQEVLNHEDYKKVRVYIAGRYAQAAIDQSEGINQLEAMALQNLLERVPFERDSEFLLKVFAVANKAERRVKSNQQGVLDPTTQTSSVVITLTSRLTERLNSHGQMHRNEQSSVSISGGKALNPTFAEVDGLFSISSKPVSQLELKATHRAVEPTTEELTQELLKGIDDD